MSNIIADRVYSFDEAVGIIGYLRWNANNNKLCRWTYPYLATPFTHDDPTVEEQRLKEAARLAHRFFTNEIYVLSPICHSYPIHKELGLPSNYHYWRHLDETLIRSASLLLIATMSGWMESKGIGHEMKLAKAASIPLMLVEAET